MFLLLFLIGMLVGAMAATILAHRPVSPSCKQYTDVEYCPECGGLTNHLINESTHERDSSGEWKQCQVCDHYH